MKIKLLVSSVLMAGALMVTNASAGPAWDFTSAGNSFSNGSWDFGNNFTVTSNVSVSGLGYYADPNNGFVDSNQVALYDSVGNLLASATVNNTYPEVGHFRYVTIATPVTLVAGQTYQIDGVSHSDNYTWNDTGFVTAPAINYLGNIWQLGTAPTFQAGSLINDVTDGYWGPNLFLGQPTFTGNVPEPDLIAMIGIGLAGMFFGKRRKLS
jgi:Domain of unknown function (DUF4082)/PEP-CTERM motif